MSSNPDPFFQRLSKTSYRQSSDQSEEGKLPLEEFFKQLKRQ